MPRSENNKSSEEDSQATDLKKGKLVRTLDTLKLVTTEAELNYRKTLQNKDIFTEFPGKLKCTKCQFNFTSLIKSGKDISSHPLLDILMCEECTKFYGNGDFSLDEDNEDKYCRWCGEGGRLFLCSKCICGFCPRCIRKHFGKAILNEIENDDDWVCYFCNPEPMWNLRAICAMAKIASVKNCPLSDSDIEHTLVMDDGGGDNNDMNGEISNKTNVENTNGTAKYKKKRMSYKQRLKKNLPMSQNSNSLSNAQLSESTNSSKKGITIKRKWSISKNSGITPVPRKRRRIEGSVSPKLSSSTPMSFLSDSSEDDSLDADDIVSVSPRRNLRRPRVKREKNVEKLEEILSVAELTAELCLKMCRKKRRKFNQRDFELSNNKLLSECERLKSMIILLSSSLTTVHGLILSLEEKCGNKESPLSFFGGRDDTSTLSMMGKILQQKNLNLSYIVHFINNIFKPYSYIGINSKPARDTMGENLRTNIESVAMSEKLEHPDRKMREANNKRNWESGQSGTNDNDVQSKNKQLNSAEKENVRRGDCDKTADSQNDGISSDISMNQINDNIEKLKSEILRTSSESSDESSSVSSLIISPKSRNKNEKNRKSRDRKKRLTDAKDKDLGINLRCLECATSPKRNEVSSDACDSTCKQPASKSQKESDSDSLSSRSYFSERDSVLNYMQGIDCVKNNSLILKKYILESTTEDEISEDDIDAKKSDEDTNKKKSSRKKGNSSRSSRRIRDSLSDIRESDLSELSTDSEDIKKKDSSDEDFNSKDNSSSTSANENTVQRKKRKRNKIIYTSDEDDVIPVNVSKADSTVIDSPSKGRKNIKKIMKKENLKLETRQAGKAENERKKKVAEKNEIYNQYFPNFPESDGLVLDFNKDTGEVILEVPQEIAKFLKPHQKKGVKFMWDCCFESVTELENSSGSGCILAHCMGLGKTLQIIALIYTILKADIGLHTVLIVCPLNVVHNWDNEFQHWLKDCDYEIDVYTAHTCSKSDRYHTIKRWYTNGGVLIVSYDMLRNNTKNTGNRNNPGSVTYAECLLDPGPDLVVCDEGHVLKNEMSKLSKCMMNMKTSRRIVLTGTPLQNNLVEYHSMVQFIKPNVLGTRKEFMNRFGNPIMNGQFEDSTADDVKLMRARSHVLHKMLEGCVQRFNYSVLTPFLPEKLEYVISIRLTGTQASLYKYYVEKVGDSALMSKNTKLFQDFHLLQKVWTHPKVLYRYMDKKANDDAEFSDSESQNPDEPAVRTDQEKPDTSIYDDMYWKEVIKPVECERLESSGKLLVLFHILKQCHATGDKLLVFSHSLYSLNLIEHFLLKYDVENANSDDDDICIDYKDSWTKNVDYFRMDGSTSIELRMKWCRYFNNKKNTRARLFLISTKAGGMGINLIAANRVVLFDVSWNPSNDVQSIYRVFRFGQEKRCYVYRLVAEGTMEEKIYRRQVTKVSLEKRVLDEHQIERHYKMDKVQELYIYDPTPREKWVMPKLPKDLILADILKEFKDVVVSYHEHDSLLENKEEEELTEEERRAAWEDYEKEKQMMESRLQHKKFMPAGEQSNIHQANPEVRPRFQINPRYNPLLLNYRMPNVHNSSTPVFDLRNPFSSGVPFHIRQPIVSQNALYNNPGGTATIGTINIFQPRGSVN